MKKLRQPPLKQKIEMPDFEAISNPTAPEAKSQPDVPKKPDLGESVYRTRRRVALACLLGATLLGSTGLYVACGPDDDGSADVTPKPKKLVPGSKFMEAYVEEKDSNKRNMMVLDMVAKGNMPSWLSDSKEFAVITHKGRNGTTLKFRAAKTPLRIGDNHDSVAVPLDGPTAQAAAEVQGYSLSTPLLSDLIFEQALTEGGYIPFVDTDPNTVDLDRYSIAKSLNENTDNKSLGVFQIKPEAVQQRNLLLDIRRKELKIKNDQLVAGHFKDVSQPFRFFKGKNGSPNIGTKTERNGSYRLEIYGLQTKKEIPFPISFQAKRELKQKHNLTACYQRACIQGFSGGAPHEASYADYSHGVRFVLPTIEVNGQEMSLQEFFSVPKYAIEFGSHLFPERYTYPKEVKEFVEDHKKKTASE